MTFIIVLIAAITAYFIYTRITEFMARKLQDQISSRAQSNLIYATQQRILLDQEMLAVAKMLMSEAELHQNEQQPSDRKK